MSKDEDLDERPSVERELDRDRQASLASSSTARLIIRERKLSRGEGSLELLTCFKNIWRLSCLNLRDIVLTSCNSSEDKYLVLLFLLFWMEVILLR